MVNPKAPCGDVKFPFAVTLGPSTTRKADQMTVPSWFDLNIIKRDAKALLGAAIAG